MQTIYVKNYERLCIKLKVSISVGYFIKHVHQTAEDLGPFCQNKNKQTHTPT